MALGRPRSSDSPAKYAESYRLFRLSRAAPEPGRHASDELAAYLEWAISRGGAGFDAGDMISVTALAKGVEVSRNTAGKSVETLVAKGMLVQSKPKSPYRIVSTKPIFKDTGVVADEQISLTLKVPAYSHITRVGACELGSGAEGGPADFLRQELAGSHDPLVHEAAEAYWNEGRFPYYLRLRTVEDRGRQAGALLEITYLRLPPETETGFREGVGRLRDNRITQISLYPLLAECGLKDMRSGRSHATVAATPQLLLDELAGSVDTTGIDMGAFTSARPLLKWTYGIFHPEARPMITFSVCFVDADLLSIFIRNLDVELGDGG